MSVGWNEDALPEGSEPNVTRRLIGEVPVTSDWTKTTIDSTKRYLHMYPVKPGQIYLSPTNIGNFMGYFWTKDKNYIQSFGNAYDENVTHVVPENAYYMSGL